MMTSYETRFDSVDESSAQPSGHPAAAHVWWDINTETVDSPDDAEGLVYETLTRVFPDGGHGFTSWWAPRSASQREDCRLRVDLDTESGRAAVQWLPTGETAFEPGVNAHHSPLTVSPQPTALSWSA